ncbi:hypothetical protein PTI98_000505 [Pleurotus ostreatus]|nr:hypothetical protein PTI98_000505 [Pleurotus ostreatus]
MISKIFGFLAHDFNLDAERRLLRYPHLKWMPVTHVCRAWRNISLNEPALWTSFVSVHPKFIQEIFARTGTAPLTLRHDGLGDLASANLRCIFEHIVEHPERVKKLSVYAKVPFVHLFNKPAPFLKILITAPDVEFPPDFLGGVAPRLTYVNCRGCLPPKANWLANITKLDCGQVYLEATYLSNLTQLRLHRGWAALDAEGSVIQCPGIDLLLSGLENMPSLQCLHVTLPEDMDTAPSTRSTPIHLPHLRGIVVRFEQPNIATMFDHLRVDNIESLHASWKNCTPVVEPVLHFFDRCYHGSNLHYLMRAPGEVEMCHPTDSNGVHIPILSLKGRGPIDLASILSLVTLCVPRIFQMKRSQKSGMPLDLKECETIEELHLSASFDLSALFDLDEDTSPPYPSLRRLRLEGTDFVCDSGHIPLLKRWLARRQSTIDLVLEHCDLSQSDLESLQEVACVTVS